MSFDKMMTERPTVKGNTKLTEPAPEFTHPTPLKILLYAKSKENAIIGVRELQRELGIKTISTISWHLDKMIDAGYVVKLPTNKYQLTDKAKNSNEIEISINLPVSIIRGKLMPKFAFSFGLLLSSVIFYVYLMLNTRNPYTTQVYGLAILLFVIVINLYQLIELRRKIKEFIH
ncbi:MAG: winged helix-turn-helix domain-containing protein [Candidatus Kariarchaeaceae archaeon]